MAEINEVPLCETCPARGLCVGDVTIRTTDGLVHNGGRRNSDYTGVMLVAVDADGVQQVIGEYVPEHIPVQSFGKTKSTETSEDSQANRSDAVFEVLTNDARAEVLLNGVKDRAEKCSNPGGAEWSSWYAQGYVRVCRAAGFPVLEALVERPNTSS